MGDWAQVAAVIVSIIVAFTVATYVLTNRINAGNVRLQVAMAALQTELALLKEREKQRGEKLDQMWGWWLKTIENGWVAQMKAVAGGK